jgi:hypothetical protein
MVVPTLPTSGVHAPTKLRYGFRAVLLQLGDGFVASEYFLFMQLWPSKLINMLGSGRKA